MKKLWIAVSLVLLASGGYLLFLYERKPAQHLHQPIDDRYVAAEGKVEAMPGFDVDVGTGELNGKVGKILVKEGEWVKGGQVVAILENEDLNARVRSAKNQLTVARSKLKEIKSGAREEEIREAAAALEGAKAAMEEAERQFERYAELHEKGMVSQADLDEKERVFKTVQAGFKQSEQRKKLLEQGPKPETVKLYEDEVKLAQAELEYNQRLLEKTVIRTPISGIVLHRYLDEGEGVTPEIPILAVADPDKMWINAEADETDIGKIKVGDKVEISSDAYRGRVFKGQIQQIADYAGVRKIKPSNPAINLGIKVVQVKIALGEKTPLKFGMSVDVRVITEP